MPRPASGKGKAKGKQSIISRFFSSATQSGSKDRSGDQTEGLVTNEQVGAKIYTLHVEYFKIRVYNF